MITHTFSSVRFSHSVVSDSLQPHELQHSRPPCPSPTPGVHSKLTSIESMMPSSHLILCRPFFLLPPIPPSIRVFPMRHESYLNFVKSLKGSVQGVVYWMNCSVLKLLEIKFRSINLPFFIHIVSGLFFTKLNCILGL